MREYKGRREIQEGREGEEEEEGHTPFKGNRKGFI